MGAGDVQWIRIYSGIIFKFYVVHGMSYEQSIHHIHPNPPILGTLKESLKEGAAWVEAYHLGLKQNILCHKTQYSAYDPSEEEVAQWLLREMKR